MRRFALHALILLLVLLGKITEARAQQVHALWGFEADGPFSGTLAHTTTALKENFINAVFADKLDPELMNSLRTAGIKVYATVQVFGGHSAWKTYPQLRPVNSEGEPLPSKYGSGICPTQRWYWPRILGRISQKLQAGYDGVWLDFIRFGSYWEAPQPQLEQLCFCDSTLADFSKASGIAIPQDTVSVDSLILVTNSNALAHRDSLFRRPLTTAEKASWILTHHERDWYDYKKNVITDFVKQAKERFAKRPGKTLGLFVVPWRRNEQSDAITRVFGQDVMALRDHVDVFSPMLYHELRGRPLAWIGGFVKYMAILTKKPVLPIIQSELGQEHRVSDEEFAAAILTALDPPSKGVIIFRQTTLVEAKQLAVLRAAWK